MKHGPESDSDPDLLESVPLKNFIQYHPICLYVFGEKIQFFSGK